MRRQRSGASGDCRGKYRFVVRRVLIAACIVYFLAFTTNENHHVQHIAVREEEFVTGERVQALCDVLILSRDFVQSFPKMLLYGKLIVYVGEPLDQGTRHIIKHSQVFFSKVEWIHFFKTIVLPEIYLDFILVTHNSDSIGGNDTELLQTKLLKTWFGQNMLPGPKTQGIPIGLENTMWGRTRFELIGHYRASEKRRLAYFKFNSYSNEEKRRQARLSLLRNGFKENESKEWPEYIRELSTHRFCFCPVGNGPDTHRMWEALYLGVTPIVIKTPELHTWFKHANILWISDFAEITPKYLHAIHSKPQGIPEIATMSWLENQIARHLLLKT